MWVVRGGGSNNNGGGFVDGSSGTNYANQDSPQWALSGLSNTGAVVTYSGASADMVGNWVKFTAGITTHTYIVSVVVGVSFTTAAVLLTGSGRSCNIGGAFVDATSTSIATTATVYLQSGYTYTINTSWVRTNYKGFVSALDDTPSSFSQYPLINTTSVNTGIPIYESIENCAVYGTPSSTGSCVGISTASAAQVLIKNCIVYNGARTGVTITTNTSASTSDIYCIDSVIYGGVTGYNSATTNILISFDNCLLVPYASTANYSFSGSSPARLPVNAIDCLFLGNGIASSDTGSTVIASRCTFYGCQDTPTGTGINVGSTTTGNFSSTDSIYAYLATAYTASRMGLNNNDFYGNTTNPTGAYLNNNYTVDPEFADVREIVVTGCTTTSGGKITKTGAFTDADIKAGKTFVLVLSGTGVTAGWYFINAVDSNNLTVIPAIAADATADKKVVLVIGNDWRPKSATLNFGSGFEYVPSIPTWLHVSGSGG